MDVQPLDGHVRIPNCAQEMGNQTLASPVLPLNHQDERTEVPDVLAGSHLIATPPQAPYRHPLLENLASTKGCKCEKQVEAA